MGYNEFDSKGEEHGKTARNEHNRKSVGDAPKLKSNPNERPPTAGAKPDGPMGGPLMTWTQMLESLSDVSDGIEYAAAGNDEILHEPVDNSPVPTTMGGGLDSDKELLNSLNQIFTPILIMQNFEGDVTEKIQESFSEANVLMERNVISFDDATRMAQLVSVCALLIARQKDSEKYNVYKKAAEVVKATKLEIQKEEYAAAQTLAQKYLVQVSTTNPSSVARKAAEKLLPETQH